MKSLYLRIYATVVVVLLLFAAISGFVFERHLAQERARNEQVAGERLGAWADLLQRSLPGVEALPEVQVAALRDWSQRLRIPLALDDATGRRIGASDSFERRTADGVRPFAFKLDDGRTLWTLRPGALRQMSPNARANANAAQPEARGGPVRVAPPLPWWLLPPGLPRGAGLLVILLVLFIAVAAVFHVALRYTRYGKYTYAIGGNMQAARVSGIDVNRHLIMVYTVAGVLAGLGGIITAARATSGQAGMGMSYELDAIAAAVIGGTSLSGGVGRITGTVVGTLMRGDAIVRRKVLSDTYISRNEALDEFQRLATRIFYFGEVELLGVDE